MPPTVTPLFRTRAAAVALLVGLSAAVAVGSLTPVSAHSAIAASAARRAVNNLLHLPAYAALTLAWAWALRAVAGLSPTRRGAVAHARSPRSTASPWSCASWPCRAGTASVGDALLNAAGAGAAAGGTRADCSQACRTAGRAPDGCGPAMKQELAELWQLGRGLARGLMRHEGSVSQKAVRSAFWVMAGMGISRVLDLVRTVILVRLLVPADFGVMACRGLSGCRGLVFTETGVGAAVVQRRDLDDETLNTAWTMQVIRNVLLYGIVWFLAPVAARFYDNPVITPILRVVASAFVCSGFRNIGLIVLSRDLDFRTTEIFQVVTETLGVAVTVVAAVILHSVWALAIGQVVFAVLKLIGSYVIHPYRPHFALSGPHMRSLFGVRRERDGVRHPGVPCNQTDSAVVGKVVGMAGLGFYSLAQNLSNLPVSCISGVLGSVAFPTYATFQRDPARLRATMGEVLWAVTVLAIPASVGLWLLAPAVGARHLRRQVAAHGWVLPHTDRVRPEQRIRPGDRARHDGDGQTTVGRCRLRHTCRHPGCLDIPGLPHLGPFGRSRRRGPCDGGGDRVELLAGRTAVRRRALKEVAPGIGPLRRRIGGHGTFRYTCWPGGGWPGPPWDWWRGGVGVLVYFAWPLATGRQLYAGSRGSLPSLRSGRCEGCMGMSTQRTVSAGAQAVPRRIGFCTDARTWGGSELYLVALVEEALGRGHQVWVMCPDGHPFLTDPGRRLPASVRVLPVAMPRGGDAGPQQQQPPEAPPHERRSASSGMLKRALRHATPGSLRRIIGLTRETARLAGLWRRAGVDLVHTNISGSETGPVAARMARIAAISNSVQPPASRPTGSTWPTGCWSGSAFAAWTRPLWRQRPCVTPGRRGCASIPAACA